MKFLDEVKIFVASGSGGAGCVSFRREKFIEFGGPDGGNGGSGGNVFIQVIDTLNTLIDFRYHQHFKAKRGGHGMGRNRTGANGEDIVIKVPMGTQVLSEDQKTLVMDMLSKNETKLLLKGGDGGLGNAYYTTSTNRSPRKNTPGWPGEEYWFWLRLKLIANVGLIGLPNAGKSTFLSVVSRAKPKIADYPFTTLHPQLGVVGIYDKEFVIADLPGLIEGAHLGVGLGHRFLGHAERCQVLLHLIDSTLENPKDAYITIRKELEMYGNHLADKQEIIVLSKCEQNDDYHAKSNDLQRLSNKPVLAMSSISRMGLDQVLQSIVELVK